MCGDRSHEAGVMGKEVVSWCGPYQCSIRPLPSPPIIQNTRMCLCPTLSSYPTHFNKFEFAGLASKDKTIDGAIKIEKQFQGQSSRSGQRYRVQRVQVCRSKNQRNVEGIAPTCKRRPG